MSRRKYNIDETWFDNIDSEEKAYFLGFLYADGNNSSTGNRKITLTLHKKDISILKKLKNLLKYEGPISEKKCKYVSLVLNSTAISESLENWGMIPRKTFLLSNLPNIDRKLIPHFIRGYFDGDGCISKIIRGDRINPKPKLKFNLVGTKTFLEKIQKVLVDECDLNYTKIYTNKKGRIFFLDYSGNLSCEKIYKYLYKDSSVFLERKKQIFERVIC